MRSSSRIGTLCEFRTESLDMTTEAFLNLFEVKPYRPFTIRFYDGHTLPFLKRGMLASIPNRRTLTVFEPGVGLVAFELNSISEGEINPTPILTGLVHQQ